VGRVVTVDVQQNQKRADYGQRLIEQLSARLAEGYGRGFTAKNLWDMKRFYEAFQIIQPLAGELADGKDYPASGWRIFSGDFATSGGQIGRPHCYLLHQTFPPRLPKLAGSASLSL
jgi:hypothetical protein